MPQLPVLNQQGQKTGTVDLPDEIFGGEINKALLHQTTVMYLANLRQGNAATKTRGEISGGGKKPWRQKGTGRARHGSTRSPLWHKGGITFGPHPRDYSYTLPRQLKVAALKESLNAKFQANELFCVDNLSVNSGKTKDFAKILTSLKIKGKVLTVVDTKEKDVELVSRNIASVNLVRAGDVNALDVLKNKKLLVTKSSIEALLKRLK